MCIFQVRKFKWCIFEIGSCRSKNNLYLITLYFYYNVSLYKADPKFELFELVVRISLQKYKNNTNHFTCPIRFA